MDSILLLLWIQLPVLRTFLLYKLLNLVRMPFLTMLLGSTKICICIFATKQIFFSFFKKCFIYLFIWLCWVFIAVRGLSSSCGEWDLLFLAVCRLLILVASLVVEHGLCCGLH